MGLSKKKITTYSTILLVLVQMTTSSQVYLNKPYLYSNSRLLFLAIKSPYIPQHFHQPSFSNLFQQVWQLLVSHRFYFTFVFSSHFMDPWLSYLARAIIRGKALDKEVSGDVALIGYKQLNHLDK